MSDDVFVIRRDDGSIAMATSDEVVAKARACGTWTYERYVQGSRLDERSKYEEVLISSNRLLAEERNAALLRLGDCEKERDRYLNALLEIESWKESPVVNMAVIREVTSPALYPVVEKYAHNLVDPSNERVESGGWRLCVECGYLQKPQDEQ